MIDQTQQDSVSPRRQAPQRRLDRTELPFFPIFIDDNFIGFEFYGFCDGFGVGTEHYSADANVSVRSHFQQMFEERPPLVGKQRSEEHTSELQSLRHLVCRLLLEKKTKFNAGCR